MSNSEKFDLRVDPGQRLAKITVFDGGQQIVAQNESYLQTELPKGLYTVRTEFNGVMDEQVIRHSEAQVLNPTLELNTAVPLLGAKYSHEYYVGPAQQWSRQSTYSSTIGDLDRTGSLFIFVRNIDNEHAKARGNEIALANFSLYNASNEIITDFPIDQISYDQNEGWAAFHAVASEGTYYLKYHGERSRTIPIFVGSHLQTQIFLMRTTVPIFRSMRVFMSRRNFDANDEMNVFIDIALNNLQSGNYYLPEEIFRSFISNKFENAIFGLVAAYIFLKSRRTDKEKLLHTVVYNLENRILNTDQCPDVQILKILLAKKYDDPIPAIQFEHPPMFRVGLESIIELSTVNYDIVKDNSIISGLALNKLSDSPWSSWSEKKQPVMGLVESFIPKHAERIGQVANVIEDLKSWIVPAILDSLERSRKRNEPPTVGSIARDVGLPMKTIRMKIEEWSRVSRNPILVASIFDFIAKQEVDKQGGFRKLMEIINSEILNQNKLQ